MTDETNYNDGKWHGWNGGDCPVHPKTIVQALRGGIVYAATVTLEADKINSDSWKIVGQDYSVIAFRVIKECREPQEFWIFCKGVYATETDADEFRAKLAKDYPEFNYEAIPIIHVREVIE